MPLQRTLKVSGPIVGSGEPLPQSKFTCASVRVTFRLVKLMLSKYSPLRPVPAVPTMTLTVPGAEVVRLSATWNVNESGPV